MTNELKERGCSCHTNAPCSFCMALNEEEADIMWKKIWYPKCIYCDSNSVHHIGKNKTGSNRFKCISCGKNYRDVYKQFQGEIKNAKYIENLWKTTKKIKMD